MNSFRRRGSQSSGLMPLVERAGWILPPLVSRRFHALTQIGREHREYRGFVASDSKIAPEPEGNVHSTKGV